MSKKEMPNIPISSVMLFNRGRLFMLCIISALMGIIFFGFGFLVGYSSGIKDTLTKNNLIPKIVPKQETVHSKSPYSFIVHIGLFSKLEYAMHAWQDVASYSQLTEAQAIVKTRINRQDFYQVFVGNFESETAAKTFSEMITNSTTKGIVPIVKKMLKTHNPIHSEAIAAVKKAS